MRHKPGHHRTLFGPTDFVVAFTGAQKGMTEAQQAGLAVVVFAMLPDYIASLGLRNGLLLREGPDVYTHGDCIGSDAQFHEFIRANWPTPPPRIEIFPGIQTRGLDRRAYCLGDVVHPEAEFSARNARQAAIANALIATPQQYSEILHSGTWQTVRLFARINEVDELSRPLYIIRPDGEIKTTFKTEMSEQYPRPDEDGAFYEQMFD